MGGNCGTCTACCRVFAIPEIGKDLYNWCQFCDVGHGCKIYEQRPQTCRDFECLWLQSQQHDGANLPLNLRPDKSRVVICPTTNPRIMGFTTMPGSPTAWRQKPVYDFIMKLVNNGFAAAIGAPGSMKRIQIYKHPDTGKIIETEVQMTEPDANGMQWNK